MTCVKQLWFSLVLCIWQMDTRMARKSPSALGLSVRQLGPQTARPRTSIRWDVAERWVQCSSGPHQAAPSPTRIAAMQSKGIGQVRFFILFNARTWQAELDKRVVYSCSSGGGASTKSCWPCQTLCKERREACLRMPFACRQELRSPPRVACWSLSASLSMME